MDNSFPRSLFKNKRSWIVVALLFIGISLIFIPSLVGTDGAGEVGESLDEYKARLEEEIAATCSSIEGVGRCRVFITFERGVQDTYKGSTLIETKPPKVLGVSVVCEGADIPSVRSALCEMLAALFDIGYNRVAISKLNSR